MSSTRASIIVNVNTSRPDVENYGINASYTLTEIATGKIVVAGTTFAHVSYDIPGQQQRFARARGLRDAELRAAKVVADNIRLDRDLRPISSRERDISYCIVPTYGPHARPRARDEKKLGRIIGPRRSERTARGVELSRAGSVGETHQPAATGAHSTADMGQSREGTPSNSNLLAALHSGLEEQAYEVRGGP